MGWYKLIFKQRQPIHVGSAKWGVVNETDIFIPGSTMWGALTNVYLQNRKENIDTNNEEHLKEIGTFFQTISNFFPSFDGKNVLQPTYQKGEFGYLIPNTKEFLPEDKFRFYFVDTLVQTAIEPVTRQAKDESLHELDYILPKPKQKLEYFRDNLYWIGIIQINEKKLKNFLKNVKNIFVGADVRYGYGELELVSVSPLDDNDKNFWWINGNNIEIKMNEPAPYFIEVQDKLEIEGETFLTPEINFRQNTHILTDTKFFISIGSKIINNRNNTDNIKLFKGKLIKN